MAALHDCLGEIPAVGREEKLGEGSYGWKVCLWVPSSFARGSSSSAVEAHL